MSAVYKMETTEPDGREPIITAVDTLPEYVRTLGMNLRERDIAIANKVGIEAHRALWRIYKKSLICKTVFLGNEIVAIWGATGTFLGKTAKPWFVASPTTEDYPMKLAFRYRSELRNMLRYFPVLEDWVQIDDKKTIRLLEIMGFSFEKPEPMGKNGIMFMRATLSKEK